MLSTPADFPFFNDCTAASTSLWGWGGHPLCLSGDHFKTDGSPLALWFYSSELYSVHQFSICRSSVRHFNEQSWTLVFFPCFTVVKSFKSWHALLLLFFLRFSSVSLHCSPTQFPFAFFMHLLLLFTSVYFSDPSGLNLFFSVLSCCHTDQEFLQWPRVTVSHFAHLKIWVFFKNFITSVSLADRGSKLNIYIFLTSFKVCKLII